MKIFQNINNNISSIYLKNNNQITSPIKYNRINFGNTLTDDCFEKSSEQIIWKTTSYCTDDEKIKFTKEELEENKEIEKYAKEENQKIIDDEFLMKFWMHKYLNTDRLEIIKKGEKLKISEYVYHIYRPIFQNAQIITFTDLYNFMKVFKANPDYLSLVNNSLIPALRTFSSLEQQSDFSNFSDIFFECFNANNKNEKVCKTNFEKYCTVLKNIKIDKQSAIPKKLEHLASKFCTFDTSKDILDAIDYLIETYPKKTEELKKLNIFQENIDERTRQFYIDNIGIVDYLYDSNNGSLSELNDILTYVKDKHKFTESSLKALSSLCYKGKLNAVETVNIFKYLKSNGISIEDLNLLTKKAIISDNDVINNVLYFNSDIAEIMSLKELKNFEQGRELYLRYPNCIHTIIQNSNQNVDMLKNFFDIVEKFNLKNGKELKNFYFSVIDKSKNNTISSKQLCGFIEQFQYMTSDDIVTEAKKKGTTIRKILKEEKALYETMAEEIDNYILEDTSNFYVGMCALDVYRKYKNKILEFPNVKAALSAISQSKTLDEYNKEQEISKFEEYIKDKKQLNKFFLNNKISFDNIPLEQEYRNSCLKILELICGDNNIKNKEEYIDYYSNSEFLAQSKLLLPEFLKSQKSTERKQKFLKLAADKKISNIPEFKTFLNDYSDEKYCYNNVIEHFAQSPAEMDYSTYKKFLENFKIAFSNYNIPTKKLNNSNILQITNYNINMRGHEFFKQVNNLYNTPKGYNFVIKLNNAFTKNPQPISELTLAEQFVTYYKTLDRQCGVNLLQLLCGSKLQKSEFSNKMAIANAIPKEFIAFMNDNDYKKITLEDGSIKTIAIAPHAILRLISRYILNANDNIEKLYTPKYKEKLHQLIQQIYSDKCLEVENGHDDRFAIIVKPGCKAYFSPDGKLITVHH